MENARKIIFDLLLEYFVKKNNLSDLIDKYLKIKRPKSQDKSLIYNISKGVVRRYITLDFLISVVSGLKIEKIDISSLIALRIALFQIIFLTRIPDYSSVSESVSIIKEIKGQKSANFVNAVLRKATRIKNLSEFLEDNIGKIEDRNKQESVRHSFPEWLIRYWSKSYNPDTLRKIIEYLNNNPEFYFRVNSLKISEKTLYDKISILSGKVYEKFFGGTAFKIKDNFEQFINSEFISKGLSFVQNLTSQAAIKYFLGPVPGEKILDIGSAPGGKSISSAVMMKNEGEIIAVESNEKRLTMLKDNLEKMGIIIVKSIKADAEKNNFIQIEEANNEDEKEENSRKQKKYSDYFHEYFDKIFMDLPCSSFGTISKNPDAKYNKNIDKLVNYKENSVKILNNAAPYLRKGGKIIFYTCTLSKIENEEAIDEFIRRNEGIYAIDNSEIVRKLIKENIKDFPGLCNLKESENIIEILPYHLNSEGASICSLVKIK